MKWYKSHIDLANHPKRYKLEEALGVDHGLHYIHLWFSYVARYYASGDLEGASPAQIARACEWSGPSEKFIDALSVSGFLDIKKGGKDGFRYIAHDWFEENRRFIEENQRRKPKGNPRVTRKKHAKNPTLEEEEEKKKKRVKYSDSFETIWRRYPRKTGKGAAWAAWSKLVAPEHGLAESALAHQVVAWAGMGTEKRFIPHLATWLNQRRWEDVVEEPPKRKVVV